MKIALACTVLVHSTVLFGNIVAAILLPFKAPWYVSLPVVMYLVNLLFSPFAHCPLTTLENVIRRKLGRPEVEDFLGHYFRWRYRLPLGSQKLR